VKLVGRIPVEPLEEERLVNIERHVVANAKLGPAEAAPRRSIMYLAAFSAAAAAALLGWQLRGQGTHVTPAAPEHFAIATDPQHSTLALDDVGAIIASDAGSTFDVTRETGKVIVKMAKGKLDLSVEHREGRLLVVRAGDTDIEDVGTKFSVAWDGVGEVDVRVREGEVKVKHGRNETLVAKGQEWRPSGLVAITEVAETGSAAVAAASGSNATTTTTTTTGSAAIVIATKEPPHVLHDREAAVPTPARPVRHVERTEEAAPVLGEPIAPASRAAAAATPSDPYLDLKASIKKQPIVGDPRIDGAGDAAAEIARLKKTAYSPTGSDEASQALYRIALLLYKPLHQDAEAMRTLDVYRRRFNAGKELSAVLWLRVRITCGRTIDEECRKAAYSYQHLVPTGDAADVAIRITNAQ
jgi:hypothetical protein